VQKKSTGTVVRGFKVRIRKLREAARLGKIKQAANGGPLPVSLPKFSWDLKNGTK